MKTSPSKFTVALVSPRRSKPLLLIRSSTAQLSKLQAFGWIPSPVLRRPICGTRMTRCCWHICKSDTHIRSPHAGMGSGICPRWGGSCERLFRMSIMTILWILSIDPPLLLQRSRIRLLQTKRTHRCGNVTAILSALWRVAPPGSTHFSICDASDLRLYAKLRASSRNRPTIFARSL